MKPDFLIAQYANIDTTFHKLGPSNPDVAPVLEELDISIHKMVDFFKKTGVDVIILSDHGQHDISGPEGGGGHGTDSPEDRLVPCTWLKA